MDFELLFFCFGRILAMGSLKSLFIGLSSNQNIKRLARGFLRPSASSAPFGVVFNRIPKQDPTEFCNFAKGPHCNLFDACLSIVTFLGPETQLDLLNLLDSMIRCGYLKPSAARTRKVLQRDILHSSRTSSTWLARNTNQAHQRN